MSGSGLWGGASTAVSAVCNSHIPDCGCAEPEPSFGFAFVRADPDSNPNPYAAGVRINTMSTAPVPVSKENQPVATLHPTSCTPVAP